jgi:sodium/potassium-transporting ATPase subunit alpha
MVTSDFKLTAQAIAIECDIITNPRNAIHSLYTLSRDSVVPKLFGPNILQKEPEEIDGPIRSIRISGPEVISLKDNQWDRLCKYEEIVFARTTPEQKLRIVKVKFPISQSRNLSSNYQTLP